jgi:hypothetical protein
VGWSAPGGAVWIRSRASPDQIYRYLFRSTSSGIFFRGKVDELGDRVLDLVVVRFTGF